MSLLPSYYYSSYPYYYDSIWDYPLSRRLLPYLPSEAASLRSIDWRIRNLELHNWYDYELPPTVWRSLRYLTAPQRVRLSKYWRDLLVEYPRFVKRLLDTEVKAGHNAYLEVRAVGSPDLTVKWYKNGQPLVETSNVYVTHYRPDSWVLTIRDALVSDRGLYSAIASNVVGESQTTGRVDVIRPKPAICSSVSFYEKLYDL